MAKKRSVTLIVSEKNNPSLPMKAGMRVEVVAVKFLDSLGKGPKRMGARLCGGSNTCIALVDVTPPE